VLYPLYPGKHALYSALAALIAANPVPVKRQKISISYKELPRNPDSMSLRGDKPDAIHSCEPIISP